MAASLPAYPPFDCSSEGRAVRWQKWVTRLNNYFTAYQIEDANRQKALLLTFAGDELNDIVDTFTEDQLEPDDTETPFSKLVASLSDHFNPQTNVEYQKFIFRQCQQKTDNIDEYYSELKQLSATCDFADGNAEIKSQLIMGCKSNKVREKGLSTRLQTCLLMLEHSNSQNSSQR